MKRLALLVAFILAPTLAHAQAVIVPSPVPVCSDGQALLWQASSSAFVCGLPSTGASAVTNDTSTSSSVYPAWVAGTSGTQAIELSSSKLSFVPSTGALTAAGKLRSTAINGATTVPWFQHDPTVSGTIGTASGNIGGVKFGSLFQPVRWTNGPGGEVNYIDDTWHLGMNLGTGAGGVGRDDTSKPNLELSWESKFYQSSTFGQEFHLQGVAADGTTTFRPLSFFMAHDASLINGAVTVDTWTVANKSSVTMMQASSANAAVDLGTTGSPIKLRGNKNNTSFLQQLNAAGSGFIDLLYLDASNVAQVGASTAITGPRVGQNFVLVQPATASTNDSAIAINVPTFSGTYQGVKVSGSVTGALQNVVENDATSGSAHARVTLQVSDGSGGDPYIYFAVPGVTNVSMGIDNSDSDKFKISAASTLGSSDLFSIVPSTSVTTFAGKIVDASINGATAQVWWQHDPTIAGTIGTSSGNVGGVKFGSMYQAVRWTNGPGGTPNYIDDTWHLGMNLGTNSGGVGRDDTSKPSLELTFESQFYANSTFGEEFHLQGVASDGATTNRPLSFFVAHDGSLIAGAVTADTWTVSNKSSVSMMQASSANAAVDFGTAASPIKLRGNKNNTAFLQQLNAAGSGFIDLMYLDASNVVQLGASTAITGPRVGQNFVLVQPATASTNDSAIAINVPTFSGTYQGIKVGGSVTGTLQNVIENDAASGSAHARVTLQVSDGSGGDPYIYFAVPGVTNWSLGIDNSDSDKFVLSGASTLGSSNALTVSTAGVVEVPGSVLTPIVASSASSTLTISSNVIAPTNAIHHLGAGLVKTITVPASCSPTCSVDIVPDAAFTTDATGNISVASTAVINKTLRFTWDGSKWNPSY
jgi:hypothetical protein